MAGTVTATYKQGDHIHRIEFACTADAEAHTFPDTTLYPIEGWLLALETNPGSTAPTNEYNITLIDAEGHDVLEGVGEDRSESDTQKAVIIYSSTDIHPAVDRNDTLTLKIADNSVNSATTKVILYYMTGY